MENDDLRIDDGTLEAEPDRLVQRPTIIDLPSSFDMAEFPSESADPVSLERENRDAPAAVALHTAASTENDVAEPEHVGPVAQAFRPAVALLDVTPSVPVAASPEPASDSAPDESLTLLQLLESNERFTWQEAVAIIQELCGELKDVPSHAPVLIEPGAIQITAAGQLHLLASQQGGDPLVIQLGRLLRSMVSAETIPSELRLLISQATFELAIFDSVEQFAEALNKLSGPPPVGGVQAAFRRAAQHAARETAKARASEPPTPIPNFPLLPAAPGEHPRKATRGRRGRFESSLLAARIGLTAAFLSGLALIGYLVSKDFVSKGPESQASEPEPTQDVSRATTPPQLPAAVAVSSPMSRRRPDPAPPRKTLEAERPPQLPAATHASARPARSAGKPVSMSPPSSVPPATDAAETSYSGLRPPSPAPTTESPADLVRRAGAFFRDGKPSEGAIVFDLLVLTAPLYEPAGGELSPDASAAFRESQRLLLPNIASSDIDKASAALTAGDPDRALTLGDRAEAVLDRFDVESMSPLRSKLQQVMRRARSIRATAENTVYSFGDGDVTPPHPLSRQFPEDAPPGVPPQRVGTLELIVGKGGDVEFVKLHTPLNRYHERMIVSAVKAWRYQPAVKAGKPVRFRLTISINLPESGSGGSIP